MKVIKRIIAKVNAMSRKRHIINQIRAGGGEISKVKLVLLGEFTFGKNLTVYSEGIENTVRSQIIVLPYAKLEIGDDVGMSQVSIIVKNSVSIGDNVKIGAGTMIFDTNFHDINWEVRRNADLDAKKSKCSPVIIEDDCFIGARVIICKGVTIGARSVIAAGSVVIKDVPADCIAGGNPCRIIRNLNEEFS